MKEYFLDANAHLPLNKSAIEALVKFNGELGSHGHPLAFSKPSREANKLFEDARSEIASMIGAKNSNQIVFTAGCTQACEWAVKIIINRFERLCEEQNSIICSSFEHPAIKQAYEYYSRPTLSLKYSTKNIDGKFLSSSNKDYVICTFLQNEIGLIYDPRSIDHEYILSDMSQALGKIFVSVSELNVDIATFGSHKFGGPTGFGFMYLKDTDDWEQFGTGSRYFTDRTGTPDVLGAVMTAAALKYSLETLEERNNNMCAFRNILETELESIGAEIVCKNSFRCANTTFAYVPSRAMKLVHELGKYGIYIGLGSACGSIYTGRAPILSALCLDGDSEDYVRISQFGYYNESDAKYICDIIKKVW